MRTAQTKAFSWAGKRTASKGKEGLAGSNNTASIVKGGGNKPPIHFCVIHPHLHSPYIQATSQSKRLSSNNSQEILQYNTYLFLEHNNAVNSLTKMSGLKLISLMPIVFPQHSKAM
jgi:hypothetical protein